VLRDVAVETGFRILGLEVQKLQRKDLCQLGKVNFQDSVPEIARWGT
jgi:hypothetical protein